MDTFYTITTDTGEVFYDTASSDSEALSIFTDGYPDKTVASLSEDTESDISLLNSLVYPETYHILSRTGKEYIVSGNDITDATDKLHSSFPGEVAKTVDLLTGDFSLIGVVTPPPSTHRWFGGCTHWGQNNNADYNQGNLDIGFQAMQAMSWNIIRCDISMNGSGVPSSPNFQPFLDAVADAGNLDLFGIITTQNKRGSSSNAIPNPGNGSTYSENELYNQYTKGYNKAKGFIQLYPGLFKFIEAGNENDVKIIKSGSNGNTWDSSSYDLETYKMVFAEMFGILKGVKEKDPTILVGVNYTWTHYAFCQQIARDANSYDVPFDFAANHWYSDMEYATLPDGSKALGKGAKVMFDNLGTYYQKLGFSEYGLRSDKNPNNLSKANYVIDQMNKYWFGEPKLDFMVGVYELFNEPARGSSNVEAKFGLQDGTKTTLSSDVVTLSSVDPFSDVTQESQPSEVGVLDHHIG